MSETKSQSKFSKVAAKFMSGIGLVIIVLVALFVLFSLLSDKFLTGSNMYNLSRATAVNGIAALGMSCCIFIGGIDLTMGSMIATSGMILSMMTSAKFHDPYITAWPIMIPICIAFGALIGIIVGLLVNDGNMPPYIATLSFQIILRAFTQLISGASIIEYLPDGYKALGKTDFLGIPLMAWVWVVLIVFTIVMTKHTRFGRNIFAVGSNAETARLSGINLRNTRCGTWMFSGIMSAIAGLLLCARLGNGNPTSAVGYEADAIASSVIGGASMSGGEGSIIGTSLGAIILQTIRNGGTLLAWNSFILEIIIGLLILVCVLIDKGGKTKR